MAAAAVDQDTGLLQKLSLDPTGKAPNIPGAKEKAPANGMVAAVANQKPVMEWSGTPQMQDYKDATMYYGAYPTYVYGAYGGWGEYSTYLSHDGAGTPTPMCGSQASHHCQYPSTYNKQQNTTNKALYSGKTENRSLSLQGDVSTKVIDSVKGQQRLNLPLKASQNRPGSSYGRPSGRFGSHQNQTSRSTYPYYGSQSFSDRQQKLPSGNCIPAASNTKSKGQSWNQNTKQYPHLMGLHTPTSPMGQPSFYSASRMYGYNGNSYWPGLWYGLPMYGSGLYGGWYELSDGKYKPRGRGNGSHVYGNENLDGLNELKRGPRSGPFKNQGVGATVATPMKGQELSVSNGSPAAMKDQYNRADFVETYLDAKFFIIKSYSEDDVHKSIKYNVWASTTNGNKKLDAAYQEAKDKSSDSSLFLLFSVNASGQFVGLAEMVGRVDFSKTVEHWQQDKWTGCFPVKWHIVKDVPNNLLKHIILENNENKPLTNSRDTHEVKLEQGLQALRIFKDHVCKTSILDDFGFYDNREKIIQERKAKQQHSLKKVMDVKLLNESDTEEDMFNDKPRSLKLIEVEIDVLNKELPHGEVGQQNDVKKNGLLAVSANGASPKDVQSPTEKLACANGC